MSPYYFNQVNPAEMQEMSGNPFYNPLSPDPDWVRGVQAIYALMQQAEDKKKAEKEAADEKFWKDYLRQLGMKKTRAEIKETEANTQKLLQPPKEVEPKSMVSPAMVKTLMKRLDYPDEAVLEVDSMNAPALAKTWDKLQSDFASRQLQGLRVPRVAATQKGKQQLSQLKYALDTIKSRKTRFNAALSQLYANPEKSILAASQIKEYEDKLNAIELQEGDIASMMNTLDDNGELSEEQLRDLNMILKWKLRFSDVAAKPIPKPMAPKTEAEKKLPPGFTIQK